MVVAYALSHLTCINNRTSPDEARVALATVSGSNRSLGGMDAGLVAVRGESFRLGGLIVPGRAGRGLESLFSGKTPVLSTPCKSLLPLVWFGQLLLKRQPELSFPKQKQLKAVAHCNFTSSPKSWRAS